MWQAALVDALPALLIRYIHGPQRAAISPCGSSHATATMQRIRPTAAAKRRLDPCAPPTQPGAGREASTTTPSPLRGGSRRKALSALERARAARPPQHQSSSSPEPAPSSVDHQLDSPSSVIGSDDGAVAGPWRGGDDSVAVVPPRAAPRRAHSFEPARGGVRRALSKEVRRANSLTAGAAA